MENTSQSQQNKTFTLYLTNNTIGIITLQGFAGIPISPNQGDGSPVSSGNPPYINPWVINNNKSYKLVDANGGAYVDANTGLWVYPDTKGSVSYNLPDNKTTLTLAWDSSKNPMLQPSLTTANFTISQSNDGSTYYITIEANTSMIAEEREEVKTELETL